MEPFGPEYVKDAEWHLVHREGMGLVLVDCLGFIMPKMEGERAAADLRTAYLQADEKAIDRHNRAIERERIEILCGPRPRIALPGEGGECLYVMEAKGLDGVYKIGRTTDIKQRLADFQTLPFFVVLIATVPCQNSGDLERWYHARYDHARLNGEWFRLTNEELRELLEDLASAKPGQGAK